MVHVSFFVGHDRQIGLETGIFVQKCQPASEAQEYINKNDILYTKYSYMYIWLKFHAKLPIIIWKEDCRMLAIIFEILDGWINDENKEARREGLRAIAKC